MLCKIKEDNEAAVPTFDHSECDPNPNGEKIEKHHRVILVEGLYLLYDHVDWHRVTACFDETWFVRVDIDVAMARVVKRHMKAWDWDEERANERVEINDKLNAVLILDHLVKPDVEVDTVHDVGEYSDLKL